MKDKLIPVAFTALITIAIAIVFQNFLHKPLDVVPLYLVPIFFYIGYLTGKSPEIWMGITLAVTVVLALLYALH